MTTQITLPEMGEGVIEGTLARWLVREGDRVERYAPIAEVETDKVTTETTTEAAGTILRLLVGEGETIPVGTVLAIIGEPGEEVAGGEGRVAGEASLASDERRVTSDELDAAGGEGRVAGEASLASDERRVTSDESDAAGGEGRVASDELGAATNNQRPTTNDQPPSTPYTGRISPVVGRIAAEHGVELGRVVGTGRDGRITKDDILAYVAGRASVDVPPAGERSPHPQMRTGDTSAAPRRSEPAQPPAGSDTELLPLTTIRRAIAEHMVRSKHTSPHVTTVFEFDFSAVAAHRRAHVVQFARDGVRLTYTAYLVAATVQALKAHPLANSSWSDEGILLHRAVHIGMATAIADGLIVPVIKNADSLNLLGLARAVNDLADRARAKQLKPDEVKGGTFSITNHGTSGSLFATPIINQPQCGILGVGAIEKRVKVIDDAIAIRPLAYVSFTFDHRILDGASADGFVGTIKRLIETYQ